MDCTRMTEPTLEGSLEILSDLPPPSGRVTDQERELANHAQVEFEGQQYDKSLAALHCLGEMRPYDHKVVHNKTVTLFYQSGFTKTDEFFKNLLAIKKQIANEIGDNEDDNLDMVYVLYNEATVCYHSRQYSAAITALGKLYKITEPLDDSFALKVCFLLVELYLITYKPEKAGAILNHIESTMLAYVKQNEYKARLNILTKSMKACKREIKSVLNCSLSTGGLFLKSNFEYLRQNYRKSIKLMNSAPKSSNNMLETGECISTMYFNNLGCIHFQMHKYNLGAFYFRRALEENDKALASLPQLDKNNPICGCPLSTLRLSRRHEILYSLGIQLLFSGRPLAAFDCLVDVIQSYHTNPRLWLRLAECCIVAHQMSNDFRQQCIKKSDIVKSVVGVGPHRKVIISPLQEKKASLDFNQGQSAAMPACTLEFSAICLQNALLLLKASESTFTTEQDGNVENHLQKDEDDVEMENLSENGLQSRLSSGQSDTSIPAPPGPPVKLRELPHIRCTILACSAYVSLGLGDNVTALSHAQRLLSQSSLVGSLKFLGHLYAAEALIKLNRIAEAIMHLSPENVIDINISPASNQPGGGSEKSEKEKETKPHSCKKVDFPQSLNEGRATLLVNLASTYCLRNELDKAKHCLHQACILSAPKWCLARIVLVAVYVELQSGNVSAALQTIKKNQFLHVSKGGVKQSKARLSDYWKT